MSVTSNIRLGDLADQVVDMIVDRLAKKLSNDTTISIRGDSTIVIRDQEGNYLGTATQTNPPAPPYISEEKIGDFTGLPPESPTSRLGIFDAIEARLEDIRLPPPVLYYRLPRAIGTTTFLLDLANRHADQGLKVLFVAQRVSDSIRIRPLLDDRITIANGDDLEWIFRGRVFNTVIGDNVGMPLFRIRDPKKVLFVDSID